MRRREKGCSRSAAVLLSVIAALVLVPAVLADVETPPAATTAVIQTTGPNGALGIGDYRANAAGDNAPHRLSIEIPCIANAEYDFDLFSASVDGDGSTTVIDEIRPDAAPVADDTTYSLYDPLGGLLQTTTYIPDSADGWVTLSTVTLPAAPVEGTHCGEYILEVTTSDDDENAWRMRVVGIDDGAGNLFPAEFGADGIDGTGDETVIGIREISYQHDPGGCQDFYWFVGDYSPGSFELFMMNFDLDGTATVEYYDPDGSTYTGTDSGATVWNDAAPQQVSRPVYADMDPINPPGDMAGDSLLDPNIGLWQTQICVGIENQYSFEVPQHIVFMDEPRLPGLTIEKDDGETQVEVGDTLSYTITITNTGAGAALPLPGTGVEFSDTLSPDTTFVSCTVNAPLVGTCNETAPGSGTIEGHITSNTNYPLAILPGVGNAPDNEGTITIEVTVNNVAVGTLLTNTASIDFSDVYNNNHPPVDDDDIDEVVDTPPPPAPPPSRSNPGRGTGATPAPTAAPDLAIEMTDPVLVKLSEPENAVVGEHVQWTITVSNTGSTALTNQVISDRVPAMFDIIGARATAGTVSIDGNLVTLTITTLAPGETITLTIDSVAASVASPPQTCNTATLGNVTSNEVCPTIFPTRLPAFGGRPPIPWAWIGLVVLVLVGAGWGVATRMTTYG